ncbi:MAG: glycosyltransferase family 4 protein [Chromatiales bacterium]|jgi:glycosyltransferase involved in cell wall biosynthesis
MKILTFSTLFPNEVFPNHGIFVEQRLKQLRAYAPQLNVQVMAPVPWFPFAGERFGDYGKYATVPENETRFNTLISHPRYPVIPKIGMSIAPTLLYLAVKSKVKQLIESGFDFDLIDAHYFYPDGVAAVMLGKKFNKPVVITARGSDVNLLPEYRIPRKQIIWAAQGARHCITVAAALKQRMSQLGIDAGKITVLRNGVDCSLFKPVDDREILRDRFGIRGVTLLSVGNLVELKGHHLVIESLLDLPDVSLLIAGSGPLQKQLELLIDRHGLQDRVQLLGRLEQSKLVDYFAAADALVLASSREGWANVLLESMACGTPVVATAVGGTPEVVSASEAGLLIKERSAKGISQAVAHLLSNYPDRKLTRAYAEAFSWDETSQGQLSLFGQIKAA